MGQIHLAQDLRRTVPQAVSCLGQRHTARVAQEQGLAELHFQRGYLLGQGGLRDSDLPSRPRQAAGLRNGQEVAQLGQRHVT